MKTIVINIYKELPTPEILSNILADVEEELSDQEIVTVNLI